VACPFGASVKSGIDPAELRLIDRSLWETVTGGVAGWLDVFLSLVGPKYITAADLCALNLDDPPLPSVGDILQAFLRNPVSILQLSNYIVAKLTYAQFALTCECNAGGSTSGYVSPPCEQLFPSAETWNAADIAGGTFQMARSWTALADSECAGVQVWFGVGVSVHTVRLWDASTQALMHSENLPLANSAMTLAPFATHQALVTGHDYTISVELAVNESFSEQTGSRSYADTTMIHDLGSSYVYGTTYPGTAVGGLAVGPLVCPSGALPPTAPDVPTEPPGVPVPPDWTCSSDADICTRLRQIDFKLDWLIRTQPSIVNSSVAEGAVHPGLSGNGTITVSNIVGVRVDLTSVPLEYGSEPGSPGRLFRVGRIDWSTSEGWIGREFLSDTPQTQLQVDPFTTELGYSFKPGIAATITELVRGPV
jgi:hypothetical protein